MSITSPPTNLTEQDERADLDLFIADSRFAMAIADLERHDEAWASEVRLNGPLSVWQQQVMSDQTEAVTAALTSARKAVAIAQAFKTYTEALIEAEEIGR